MKKLENRVVIITGAANGMGKATAKKMAEYGAKVNLIDFLPEIMNYAEELKSEGYEATGYEPQFRRLGPGCGIYRHRPHSSGKLLPPLQKSTLPA